MTAGQTNWPYVINLGNSIIGVSVLAMPFCFKTCGMILGILLLLCSAWLTNISCKLLVKAAHESRRRSYQYLAFHAIGHAGKFFVEICMIGLLLGTCIAFFVIIGDLGPAIVSRATGIENTDNLRTGMLVVMALTVSFPLALLRNLESLSNINAVSIGFYVVFIAEIFTASFPNLWSGVWVTKVSYWNPEGVFKCLPIFSLAFACQTQLFVMYDALPEPSIMRMNMITKSAIGMCVSVYLMVGYFGYVAFCDEEVQGDILMNFRPTIISEAVKFGFVMSVAVSFPLVIYPCRASIYTMFFAKETTTLPSQDHGHHDNISGSVVIPPLHFKLITSGIVLGTMVVGIMVPNIEFVLALTGATMGSMICYIFPAVVFISVMSMSKNANKSTAQFVLFLGVTILLASTYVTLNTQATQTSKDIDSVIKVVPMDDIIDDKDNLKAMDSAGDGPLGNLDVNKDKVKDIGDVNKLEADGMVDDKHQNVEDSVDDKRQEPPNPLAPKEGAHDADEQNNEGEMKEETKETADKEGDAKADVDKDLPNKEKEPRDIKEENSPDNPKDTDKAAEKNAEEAKNLLKELKEQQAEQKMLIQEQKQIIEDLKQHQKEAHQEGQEQLPVQQVPPQQEQQVAQQQEQVPQQQDLQQQVQQQQQVPQQQQQVPQQQIPQQQLPQQQVQQQQLPPQQQIQQEIPQKPQQQIQQQVPQQQVIQQQQVQPQKQMPQEQVAQQVVQQVPQQQQQQQPVQQGQQIVQQVGQQQQQQQQPVLQQGGVPPVQGGVPPVQGGVPPVQGGVPPVQGGVPPLQNIANVPENIPQQPLGAIQPEINKQLNNLGNAGGQKFLVQPSHGSQQKVIVEQQQPLGQHQQEQPQLHEVIDSQLNGDKIIMERGQNGIKAERSQRRERLKNRSRKRL